MKTKLHLKIITAIVLLLTFNFSTAQCFNKISASENSSYALKSDGSLWAWGYNNHGQLGDGTTTNKLVPTQIGSDTNWSDICAGYNYVLALKTDGTLWAWGNNSDGQLGNGTNNEKHVPTQINSDTDWSAISAGKVHTLALKTDGTLWAWGNNFDGQLGDGTTTDELVPTQVGSDNDWGTISAGWSHSLAIKTDGTLWSWGYGIAIGACAYFGINQSSPVQVNNDTDWKKINAYNNESFAIKANGSMWAWGENSSGQLGIGTNDIIVVLPNPINNSSAILYNWNTVSNGYFHTFGIQAGSLFAWGSQDVGIFGNGNNSYSVNVPLQIGNDYNWSTISTGLEHSIALKTDGSSWTWGQNTYGQLGDGTTVDKNVPVAIACSPNLAIATLEAKENIKLYPNPAATHLTIESKEAITQTIISDCNGRIIKTDNQNSNTATLNIENLQAGIYFLKIVTQNGSQTEKIVKE